MLEFLQNSFKETHCCELSAAILNFFGHSFFPAIILWVSVHILYKMELTYKQGSRSTTYTYLLRSHKVVQWIGPLHIPLKFLPLLAVP